MSLTRYEYSLPINYDVNKEYKHIIEGKMFVAQLDIPTYDVLNANFLKTPEEIKRILIEKLVNYLYETDVIDFAMQENLAGATKHYRARIFVTPKDKTQILKTVLG